jgi:hypothetical protein
MSTSTSLPTSLGPGAPMDEDLDTLPSIPSRKRSFESTMAGPSTKFARTATSLLQTRHDLAASGSSSLALPILRDGHPLMLHLDSLELAIRKGDTEMGLRRVNELRRLCGAMFNKP